MPKVIRKLDHYAPPRNQRLPAEVYEQAGTAVLFTLRAYAGKPFHENRGLCDCVVGLLTEMRREYGCWVGAYCLMPDHLHFVAGPSDEGVSVLTFVARFTGKSTNASWRHGWSGKLWQKRGHDHVIRIAERMDEVYDYILANPVRAGLVEDAADWAWAGVLDQ